MADPFHIEFLKTELEARKAKNGRYSLRAFSRSLKMDPAALSRVLNGKQELSPKACPQILRSIKAPPPECEMFIASVLAEKERAEFENILGKLQIEKPIVHQKVLPRAVYERLSNRYHPAILALLDKPEFRADTAKIAKKIGTTEIHVEWILSVLIRAGLVRREGGRLLRNPLSESSLADETKTAEPDRLLAGTRVRIDRRKVSDAQSRLEVFLKTLERDLAPENESIACSISAQILLSPNR